MLEQANLANILGTLIVFEIFERSQIFVAIIFIMLQLVFMLSLGRAFFELIHALYLENSKRTQIGWRLYFALNCLLDSWFAALVLFCRVLVVICVRSQGRRPWVNSADFFALMINSVSFWIHCELYKYRNTRKLLLFCW